MNLTLQNQAFTDGFKRQMVKQALNPRIIPKVLFDHRDAARFEAAGKSLFARSYKNPNPLSGIFNTSLAGYGQLRGIHEQRSDFLQKVKALRSIISGHPVGHPTRAAYENDLASAIKDHHSSFKKQLTELGAVSEPRRRFIQTTLPTMAGVGAGAGLGVGAGAVVMDARNRRDMQQAPVSERLQYLFHPDRIPSGQQRQSTQQSSATDTGGY